MRNDKKALEILKQVIGADIVDMLDESILDDFLENMSNKELTEDNVIKAYDEINLMNY